METSSLIIFFILLTIILLILVIIYTAEPSTNKKKKKVAPTPTIRIKARSFDVLYEIIKNKSTSNYDLRVASEELLDNYISITPKLGMRPHPDFDKYATMIMSLCRHPNTNKDIILNFDKKLQQANEEYKADIETYLAKGLSSRGL